MNRTINFVAAGALLMCTSAFAQATRTWVSGVGDDANPCSRTAPCKTFAGAISKTAAGGEISVLDPGGYGAVTITKAITISGTGTLAGILAASTNGIIVNAGANDEVLLRDLSIHGAQTGLDGIRFLGGRKLHVERCSIQGFTSQAIEARPSTAGILWVEDSYLYGNSGQGISLISPGANSIKAHIYGTRIEAATTGLVVGNLATAFVDGSFFTHSTTGISVDTGGLLRLARSTLFGNTTGVLKNGGTIASFGDNISLNAAMSPADSIETKY
jgi:hypothetical protein